MAVKEYRIPTLEESVPLSNWLEAVIEERSLAAPNTYPVQICIESLVGKNAVAILGWSPITKRDFVTLLSTLSHLRFVGETGIRVRSFGVSNQRYKINNIKSIDVPLVKVRKHA